jgi:hypothetical protein
VRAWCNFEITYFFKKLILKINLNKNLKMSENLQNTSKDNNVLMNYLSNFNPEIQNNDK